MTAKRVSQILLKRSASIYNGMKARAAKVYIKMPFTLAEFRDWLDRRFAGDGEAFCDYSGEMILVENFSVDHRQPVSRGGTFGLSNLVLCSAKESDNPQSATKNRELPRYGARPNDNHVRGVEMYSHMVWDREAEEAVAYTSSELTALNYTAQMNEKGFIEP